MVFRLFLKCVCKLCRFTSNQGFLQNCISGCPSVLRGVVVPGGAVSALCRTFSVLCGVWRRSVELSQHSQCLRDVAALREAVPALCGAFSVLGGLWLRSVELSQHSVGYYQCSAGCGGALQPPYMLTAFSLASRQRNEICMW